tara:strand:- start:2088 stop:3014 length:927 start_codon:yes stop_codon:yes gene_type:complete
MAVCACDGLTLSNTGVPSCQPLQSVVKRLIIVPLRDSSNNKNGIDLTSIPTNAGIEALINAADAKARYYPLPLMESVTNERADTITEEAPSGTLAKIRNGAKSFFGEIWFQGSTFAGLVDSFGCGQVGAFIVDGDDNLIGDRSVAGFLYPLAIKMPTWDVRTLDTTDTTVAKVTIGFQWKDAISDSDVGMLLASDFDSSTSWLDYNGLISLNGTLETPVPSATSFTMKVTTDFGSVKNPTVAGGLAQNDFEIDDNGTPLSIAQFAEAPTGVYKFEYVGAAPATYSLRIKSTTLGYDDTKLRAVVITTQ